MTVAAILSRHFCELDFRYEETGLKPVGPTLPLPGFWPGELGHDKRNIRRTIKEGGIVVLGHNWGDQNYYDLAVSFLKTGRCIAPFKDGGGVTGTNLVKLGIDEGAFFTNAYPGLRKEVGLLGTCGVRPGSDFDQKSAALFRATLELLKPRGVIGLGLTVAKFLARVIQDQRVEPWLRASGFAAIDASATGPVVKVAFAGFEPTTVVAMTHPSLWSNLRMRRFQGVEGEEACRAMLRQLL